MDAVYRVKRSASHVLVAVAPPKPTPNFKNAGSTYQCKGYDQPCREGNSPHSQPSCRCTIHRPLLSSKSRQLRRSAFKDDCSDLTLEGKRISVAGHVADICPHLIFSEEGALLQSERQRLALALCSVLRQGDGKRTMRVQPCAMRTSVGRFGNLHNPRGTHRTIRVRARAICEDPKSARLGSALLLCTNSPLGEP